MGVAFTASAVGRVLGAAAPSTEIAEWAVIPDEYPAMTPSTASLERVVATTTDGRQISVFAKTLQSIRHSPAFETIPDAFREAAVAGFPWHLEADVYASGLLADLPDGLRSPRLLLIEELGDDRTRLWIEDVAAPPAAWDLARYQIAARALGRLAGRFPAAGLPAELPPLGMGLRAFFRLRIESTVLPPLRGDQTWGHPLMRTALAADPVFAPTSLHWPTTRRCSSMSSTTCRKRWPTGTPARRTSLPIPSGWTGSSRSTGASRPPRRSDSILASYSSVLPRLANCTRQSCPRSTRRSSPRISRAFATKASTPIPPTFAPGT